MKPRRSTKKPAALSVVPTPLLWTRADILFDGTEMILGGKPIREAVSQRRTSEDAAPKSAQPVLKAWSPKADPNVHYSPTELAEAWGLSVYTIRRQFETEPGVMKIGKANQKKRRYFTLRIPQEVALRVHRRLCS